jgi:hypothetical protein
MIKAIVSVETNLVDNIVVWDGETEWQCPDGFTVVDLVGNAGIGWSYINGEFIAPTDPNES